MYKEIQTKATDQKLYLLHFAPTNCPSKGNNVGY